MNPNPIFMPVSREETKGSDLIKYCECQIAGRNIRVIEYYDSKDGSLKDVNVRGICGKVEYIAGMEEFGVEDRLVAHDRKLDRKTMKEIEVPFRERYPKPIKVGFFNTEF